MRCASSSSLVSLVSSFFALFAAPRLVAGGGEAVLPQCGDVACPVPGARGPSRDGHGNRKWHDLVHYHIAKNAGTTLRSVITKRYKGMELHGPGKKEYGHYFNSMERKWRGRYFVAMAREPTSKLMSQFFYVRGTLSGAFGEWHRCVTFGEYVESKRARHNHQFSQLIAGSRKARCGGGAPGANETLIPRPRHELGHVTVDQMCAGGEVTLRERMLQILRQPRLFVGLVEAFDASLLVLQAETGLPDVTYCHRRSTKGALNKPKYLDAQTLKDAAYRNSLDELFYSAATEVFEWKRCCFGITDAKVADFQRANAAYQERTGCSVKFDKMQKTIDNATLGNPNWHDRANSDKCAALDHVKYALPRRDGKPDHGGWKPSPEADEGAADRWGGYT